MGSKLTKQTNLVVEAKPKLVTALWRNKIIPPFFYTISPYDFNETSVLILNLPFVKLI